MMKVSKRTNILMLGMLLSLGSIRQGGAQMLPLSMRIDPIVSAAEAKYRGRIGMSIQRLSDDSVIYRTRFTELFTPASVVKVLSTGAALTVKGPTYRFPTEVYISGEVKEGTLLGNIIIRGYGDPSIGSSYIPGEDERFVRNLVQALKSKHIQKISGGVYFDASLPTGLGQVSGWLAEDKKQHYGAGLFGLNYRDNVMNLSLTLSGEAGTYKLSSSGERLGLKWALRENKSNGISLVTEQSNPLITIVGNSKHRQTQAIRMPNPAPAQAFAFYVLEGLQKNGIVLQNNQSAVSYEGYEPQGELLHTHYSKRLDTLARITNYRSQNFYAEAIGRLVNPNIDKGQAITNYWQQTLKIGNQDLLLYDGSGLDRRDRVSPRAFSLALKRLFGGHIPLDGVLLETLPEVGREGTVRHLMPSRRDVKVYLKSGTMRGVSTYVGYVYDGRDWYSIVYLTNGMPGAWASRAVLHSIVQEAWRITDDMIPLQAEPFR